MKNAARNYSIYASRSILLLLLFLSACSKAPTADFSISPTTGSYLDVFTFDGSASHDPNGNIAAYNWDLGDGTTSANVIVEHTYDYPGEYTAQLTVIDQDGNEDTKEATIEAGNLEAFELLPSTMTLLTSPDLSQYAAISNSHGDIYQLFLPPNAVDPDIEITFTILENNPSDQLSEVFSPGFKVEPDGLVLKAPARIWVTLGSELDAADTPSLFQIQPDGQISYILSWDRNPGGLKGEIAHFSQYTIGEPTSDQLLEMKEDIETGSSYQDVPSMLGLAELLDLYGHSSESVTLINAAQSTAHDAAEDFFNQGVQGDPCGNYLHTLLMYGRLLNDTGETGELVDLYRARASAYLSQCPIKGNVGLRFFTVPAGLHGEFSDPIPFISDLSGKLGGGGSSQYLIGGPGIVVEGARLRVDGGGPFTASIDGEILLDDPLEATLKAAVLVETANMQLMVFADTPQGNLIIGDLTITGQGDLDVQGEITFPISLIAFSGSVDQEDIPIALELRDGAQDIDVAPVEMPYVGYIVWSLSLSECSEDSECDDGKVCTRDECKQSKCVFMPDDTIIPPQVEGDCRRCENGEIFSVKAQVEINCETIRQETLSTCRHPDKEWIVHWMRNYGGDELQYDYCEAGGSYSDDPNSVCAGAGQCPAGGTVTVFQGSFHEECVSYDGQELDFSCDAVCTVCE